MKAVVFAARCATRSPLRLTMQDIAIAGYVSILPAPRSWPGPLSLRRRSITRRALPEFTGHPPGDSASSAGTAVPSCCSDHGKTVDLNYVTLDDPEQLEPEYHIYTESRLKWLNIDDNLPRYRQDIPE